jgi:hypothetical protein
MFLDANTMGIPGGQQGIMSKKFYCSCRVKTDRCCCDHQLANDNNHRCFCTERRGRCCPPRMTIKTTNTAEPSAKKLMIAGGKTDHFSFPIRVRNPKVGNHKPITVIDLQFLSLEYACQRLVFMSPNRAFIEIFFRCISIMPYGLRLFGLIIFAISPYIC